MGLNTRSKIKALLKKKKKRKQIKIGLNINAIGIYNQIKLWYVKLSLFEVVVVVSFHYKCLQIYNHFFLCCLCICRYLFVYYYYLCVNWKCLNTEKKYSFIVWIVRFSYESRKFEYKYFLNILTNVYICAQSKIRSMEAGYSGFGFGYPYIEHIHIVLNNNFIRKRNQTVLHVCT